MLILAKASMAIMLGFVLSLITGLIIVPLFKRLNFGQSVSKLISKRHLKKEGTPTMGGVIFIIPVILSILLLYLRGSINISYNLIIVLFVFLAYGFLGFLDDFLKVKYHNNNGISLISKFLMQMIIALIFFYLFMKGGGEPALNVTFLNINLDLGWMFGIFILFLLVGTTNAVNITDGLDGLAAGLSAIAFFAYGVISWNAGWLDGYQEIAIFCFLLAGSLIGFLVFNSHPARIFMGDLGSLALGGALASIAILSRHEISLAIIGGVFVIETLSSLIQIIAIRYFNKKVFLKAPLHHHFEELGWQEPDIIKLFWILGFILAMAAITYGVWL